MKIRIFFAWYDMWVGAYWDRKKKILYICPVPMVVIQISKNDNWMEEQRKRLGMTREEYKRILGD